jgi:hypothetical protein
MSQIEVFLNQLEARLRLLIEGDASHDGFPPKLHRQLLRELNRALRCGARLQALGGSTIDSKLVAPDQFTLVMPAIEAQVLLTHPTELDRLTRKLIHTAAESGMMFVAPPLMRVVADPKCMALNILANFSQPGMDDSSTYQLECALDSPFSAATERLPKAFLIVNGLATFSIKQPVINIGRDSSNQLRLVDPQISRQHAQLRFIQGHFVVFDLDSGEGTFVNGVPVSSHVLKPGDVIQLASLPLVFGVEGTVLSSATQELPASPPPLEVL